MKLSSLKKSGHTPTLLCAFLHFDISFMIWVILGALAPFLTTDAGLTGVNLQVTPLAAVQARDQYTLIVKAADPAKGQPATVYNLLVKPGGPATATRASVKPVESFVVRNDDPASIARVNEASRLIRVQVAPDARGNPNDNVVPLVPAVDLERQEVRSIPVANGFPASLKLTLVGVPLLAAAFWRILLGILADRFGSKRVGVVSLSITLVPLFLGWQGGTTY
ncbi:MAG TPA: hypothetical protein VEJ18_13340, partial [Planctomycetota bacterium]|nr:hypothetical protein [Planctomycetota bacterium]